MVCLRIENEPAWKKNKILCPDRRMCAAASALASALSVRVEVERYVRVGACGSM